MRGIVSNNSDMPLQFTSNWFIDAGILGFANQMEEVYGWDLKELQRRIQENNDLVYYGYFPFAYLFYHSKIRGTFKRTTEIRKEIKKFKDKKTEKQKEFELEIKKENLHKRGKEIEIKKLEKKTKKLREEIAKIEDKIETLDRKIEDWTKDLETEKITLKRKLMSTINNVIEDSENRFMSCKLKIEDFIPNFDLNLPQDHRNFFLYNPKKGLFESFGYLYFLLNEKYETLQSIGKEVSYEKYPDSTINPFLYSPKKFLNIGYTPPLSIEKIRNGLKLAIPAYLPLLSFSNAYQYLRGRHLMFYTNNLEVCYNINKKIKINIEMLKKSSSIFQITWLSILDELTESKAKFALENMYLIEFEGIENQKLKNVEYMGISKIVASIILDDDVREKLNVSLAFRKIKDRDNYRWLLEELLKNKPLYPIILGHVSLAVKKKNQGLYRSAIFYALASDVVLNEVCREDDRWLFSEDFFEKFSKRGNLPKRIRYLTNGLYHVSNSAKKAFFNDERNIAPELYAVLKKKNKNAFINIVLKNLIGKDKTVIKEIVDYMFRYIITNDNLWEHYALPLLVGTIGGAKNEE